ncbi:hypothetical protein EUX98_g390 [Antrodiella citrinella]|uniref:C2H2-type domain-containing protein n=1 Tax=Antrodiella citrinella TaxID=2447956 RepID=A0A4S4N6T2_9APHY|nr:hypothetical protein EUX98_g390 [Antrodiella citrinella]
MTGAWHVAAYFSMAFRRVIASDVAFTVPLMVAQIYGETITIELVPDDTPASDFEELAVLQHTNRHVVQLNCRHCSFRYSAAQEALGHERMNPE